MTQLIEGTKGVSRDSRLLRKALMIACPVVPQGTPSTVVNLVNILIIGTMGATATATVGLTNKFFLVFSLLVFGIVSGSGILVVQFWGNDDLRSIREVLELSILSALTGALLFVVPALMSFQPIVRIFTASYNSVGLGAKYLETAALIYPFLTMTNIYVAILRTVDKVISPVISSCIAILVNICLNCVPIFGKFGAPAMGVSGVAVTTLITRTIEIVLVPGYVYGKKSPAAYGLRELSGWSGLSISQFLRTSVPVIINEFMWRLGTIMYSLAYGRVGDEAVAAITIATTIQDILVVLFQDLSAATAVILGNELGVGHLKRAEKYVIHFFILQFIVTVGVAMVLIGTRWPIVSLYSIMSEVVRNVSPCILIFATYIPARMFNYVNVVDALRSGGDIKMCLFPGTSGVWFIGVPLTFSGALMWRLPIYTVCALMMTEGVYKAVLGYVRYRQKKWLRNLTVKVG